MNTKVWGGPLWRILHGTSQLSRSSARFAGALSEVVRTLEFVMPCSFCRESYIQFADELNIDRIETIISEGKYVRWMYDLHNKVAAKLQAQVLERAHVPRKYIAVVFEETKLPFDVLQKRLLISTPYFSASDVLVSLGILALSAKEGTCKKRKAHFLSFASNIAILVGAFPEFEELGDDLYRTIGSLSAGNFQSIMGKLLQVEMRRLPTALEKREHIHMLSYAKAGSCSAGVCL